MKLVHKIMLMSFNIYLDIECFPKAIIGKMKSRHCTVLIKRLLTSLEVLNNGGRVSVVVVFSLIVSLRVYGQKYKLS